VAEKLRADEHAASAAAVSQFLQEVLTQAAPDKNPATRKVTVEDVLRRAERRLAGRFKGKPVVEASVRQALGEAFLQLADYRAAQVHLEKALELRRQTLGEEDLDTLHSMGILGGLYLYRAGQLGKAEELYTRGLAVSRRVLGEEHHYTLSFLSDLGVLYYNLADLSNDKARLAQAEEVYLKVLALRRRILGETHGDTLAARINLALVYKDQGRYEEAERLLKEVLASALPRLGEGHPLCYKTLGNLAQVYHAEGRPEQALEYYAKTLAIRSRVQGKDHPHTLSVMQRLGQLHLEQGRFADAEPLLLSAYAGWSARHKAVPVYRKSITEILELLVRTYEGWGRDEQAAQWRQKLQEFRGQP
jgi:tetratricopeptide (TPR) repeat protein